MPAGTFRERLDGVPIWLSCELVSIPWDNEEVLHVLANDLAIVAPERSDGVQQQSKGIKTDIPQLLIVIAVIFLESDDLRQLDIQSSIAARPPDGVGTYLRIDEGGMA